MGQIPIDGPVQAVDKFGLRQPGQLPVDLAGVDGIAHIVALPIGNESNQTLRLAAQLPADQPYNVDVPHLVVAAHVVDLAHGTLAENAMRWGIETSFRELKYTVGLQHFHAKKVEFVHQEIFARLTMYNFYELITQSVVIQQKEYLFSILSFRGDSSPRNPYYLRKKERISHFVRNDRWGY